MKDDTSGASVTGKSSCSRAHCGSGRPARMTGSRNSARLGVSNAGEDGAAPRPRRTCAQMALEVGSKLNTLLVEYNAALIARAKGDRLTFSVYQVRGKRFLIMDSAGVVEIFAPVPASPVQRLHSNRLLQSYWGLYSARTRSGYHLATRRVACRRPRSW